MVWAMSRLEQKKSALLLGYQHYKKLCLLSSVNYIIRLEFMCTTSPGYVSHTRADSADVHRVLFECRTHLRCRYLASLSLLEHFCLGHNIDQPRNY